MSSDPVTNDIPAPPTAPVTVVLGYAPPVCGPNRWGKGFLAACATLVCWGLGHRIAAHRRARLWFAAWLVCNVASLAALIVPNFVPALVVLVPLSALLGLAALVDAFIVGRRSDRAMLGAPLARYAAGIGLLFLAWGISKGLGLYVRSHWVEAFVIPTNGMAPTLQPNDRFLTHKSFVLRRWDVVMFRPPINPRTLFAQRVVGLPGEKVELVQGALQINGVPITPPHGGTYVSKIAFRPANGCEGNPIVLGPDEYFVLGDNSAISLDARYWNVAVPGHQMGALPRSAIVARATAIYYPLNRLRMLK